MDVGAEYESTRKKPSNLRLIEIINEQKYNDFRVLDPQPSRVNKNTKPDKYPRGKKIDNKTIKIKKNSHLGPQEYAHVPQLTDYNTNTESVSNIETLPFRDHSRHGIARNEFSEATHSICTFDINEQLEKGRRLSHNRRVSEHRVEWNKENTRSHSRNSLGFQRKKEYARKGHNRSCNDMEYKQESRKKSKDRRKGNLSCAEDKTTTVSPDRRKKTPKKNRKSLGNITKNPTVSHINFKKVTLENSRNKKKTIEQKGDHKTEQKSFKKKEPKGKKDVKELKEPKEVKESKDSKINKLRRRSSLEMREDEVGEELEYPVSKYVNHRKPSREGSQSVTIRNTLVQHILESNSSLVKSLVDSKREDDEGLIDDLELINIGESSLNLKEIRKFEEVQKISREKLTRNRKRLCQELSQEYPELDQPEIEFLGSVVFIQREWRKTLHKRNHLVPDSNLTSMLKDILSKAIKSQQVSPQGQLAETTRVIPISPSEPERARFFREEQQTDEVLPSSQKDIGSPIQSVSFHAGDLQIPESRASKLISEDQKNSNLFSFKILQKEVFPPLELLDQQRHLVLKRYSEQMEVIEGKSGMKSGQHHLKEEMRRELREADQDAKSIQKGYLSYLHSLMKVKTTTKSRTLLRKVSSSQGLMFDLYKKVFKMEERLKESSSVESLAKKVLIRKEWFREGLEHFGSAPASPIHLSFSNSSANRKLQDFMGQPAQNIRKRQQTSRIVSINSLLQQVRHEVSENNSEEYETEIMESLLKEGLGEEEEEKVNEVVEEMLDLLYKEFVDDIGENRKLRRKVSNALMKRHMPGIDCSDQAINYYLTVLIDELLATHQEELVRCLNTPLGFSSLSILKLMRDPSYSPPEGYSSPIDSRTFQTVQKLFFQKIDFQETYKSFSQLVEGLMNVHNKAVYECFLSEIELLKPHGEAGVTHAWNPPRLSKTSTVTAPLLPSLMSRGVSRVLKFSSFKSGLILQNWVTRSSRELDKAYEQNQQRMVAMIEFDLGDEQRQWEDMGQFVLEVRLDVEVWSLQCILDEAVEDMLRIQSMRV